MLRHASMLLRLRAPLSASSGTGAGGALGVPIDVGAAIAPVKAAAAARLDRVGAAVAALTGQPAPEKPKDFLTIHGLFERWQREAKPAKGSVIECEYSCRRFKEMFGDLPVEQITKIHIREFLDARIMMPSRLSNDESKLPVPEILERYKNKDVPRATPSVGSLRLPTTMVCIQPSPMSVGVGELLDALLGQAGGWCREWLKRLEMRCPTPSLEPI
jgi:hypothetical protein